MAAHRLTLCTCKRRSTRQLGSQRSHHRGTEDSCRNGPAQAQSSRYSPGRPAVRRADDPNGVVPPAEALACAPRVGIGRAITTGPTGAVYRGCGHPSRTPARATVVPRLLAGNSLSARHCLRCHRPRKCLHGMSLAAQRRQVRLAPSLLRRPYPHRVAVADPNPRSQMGTQGRRCHRLAQSVYWQQSHSLARFRSTDTAPPAIATGNSWNSPCPSPASYCLPLCWRWCSWALRLVPCALRRQPSLACHERRRTAPVSWNRPIRRSALLAFRAMP